MQSHRYREQTVVVTSGERKGGRDKGCVCVCVYVCVFNCSVMSDSATPWTVALQTPSKGFYRQEYWSGLPFLPPGALPDPEIEPMSFASPT